MNPQRKTVLITGCSPGGIGNALAREFHSKGLRVFATARKTETISDLSDLGIEALSLEVHKPESIKTLKSVVEERSGGTLDFLVNNAGRNYTVPGLDLDFEEVIDLFSVNVFAVMRMCQEFAPLLIRAKGVIIQIGSLSGIIPHVFSSSYNASKAALHAYSNTMRVELAPFGVKVIVICTGGVESRIARVERSLPPNSVYLPISHGYQKRLTQPQEEAMPSAVYARSVVKQVLQPNPKGWIWEGSYVWLMWFFSTFMPKSSLDRLFSKMFYLNDLGKLDMVKKAS